MRKPRPDSNLADLSPEQADQLYELLRSTAYYAAVTWVADQWDIAVSISGLRRWWDRESRARARSDLRSAIAASREFDSDLDSARMDEAATNALRAAYWQAVASGNRDAIKTFATLVLDYKADDRDGTRLTRELAAERRAREAEAAAAAARNEIAALRTALAQAGRANAADPAAVAAEVDKLLGRQS